MSDIEKLHLKRRILTEELSILAWTPSRVNTSRMAKAVTDVEECFIQLNTPEQISELRDFIELATIAPSLMHNRNVEYMNIFRHASEAYKRKNEN